MVKHITYSCDICLKPIESGLYTYTGCEFDWLLGDNGFHLHQEGCTEIFSQAQEAAQKAGQEVLKQHLLKVSKWKASEGFEY